MKKQIVINASKDRSRIAIVEDGELVELYIETPDNVRSIGNVYLAEIQKVMPALRAAFVDVGQKQDCFLHFSDLTDNLPQLLALAGEDVPGLDEPVLSLAPPKRVADDENEPDVEESLEIEPAPEESRSRRTSRRRSRGRGRGRGRGQGGGGREEEEEQEEKPRRALPSVIDLTAPAKPRRKPDLKPEPTPEPDADAPEPEPVVESDASSADATAPVEEAAPKKKRTRSRKKADPTPETDDVPIEEAELESDTDPEADTKNGDEADASEPKKKRRRRGRRGRGKGDDAPNDESEDAPDDSEPTADADDSPEPEVKEDAPATPRRSRSRKKDTSDAFTEADDAGSENKDDAPKAKSSGRGRKSLPATLDLTSSAKPKRSRPEPSEDSEEDSEAPKRSRRSTRSGDTASETPSRGRGGKSGPSEKLGPSKRSSSSGDASSSRGTRSDNDAQGGGDESSPRGFKKPASASDDTSDTASQDDADEKTSSRRRSGRGRKASDETTDTLDTKDESSNDEPKGRGRGRSRGGRTEGGRSKDESSSKDSSRSESDKDTSDSDGRSGRGRSDRSGNGRSTGGRSGGGRDGGRDSRSSGRNGGSNGRSSNRTSIPSNENLLKRGGKIIVKITKEAISNKGPRVSTDLSLAGRFLVLVPAADYVAVSKKIESAKERRRLRTLATNLKPDGFGVIVRTVAEGRDAKSLDTDLRLLADKWRKIQNKLDEKPNPPVLLYQDVNMVSSVIRDLFSEDYDRILVDDEKVFRNVQAYVKAVAPQMADKVELHKGRGQVYRSLGIEKQVEEAFSKRVNMKSGGYLFIETTEAMHVVDVNSGRAGRGKSQKQNLIDVNVEAAKEVAKQLRLRDLGGIIVVDFIDLKYDRDRRKVTDALKAAFEKDRAVTKLLPMSDFGLVQITRQRLRPSITANAVDEDGEPLDGVDAMEASGASEIVHPGKSMDVGIEPESLLSNRDEPQDDRRDDRRGDRSQSRRPAREAVAAEDATPQALAAQLRGWLEHYRQTVDEKFRGRPIVVRVHPLFDDFLKRGFIPQVTRWRLSSLRGITFRVESDPGIDPTAFDVRDQKSGRSLLKKYDA